VPLAVIRFSQAALPEVPAGTARRDIAKGVPVVLRNNQDAGVTSWRWTLLAKPPGSTAVIMNPTSAVANLTPDIDGGSYRVQLAVNQGRFSHGETQIKVFRVPDASGFAAPAVGERGSEVNYIIDGNPNTAGYADEFLRRYLFHWNNRTNPFTAIIAGGANHTFEIPWNLSDAMLQYLRVVSVGSTDFTLGFYANAIKSRLMYEVLNIDATNAPLGYVLSDHRTLTYGDPPIGMENGKIYLKVSNNDVPAGTVTIYMRIGAL